MGIPSANRWRFFGNLFITVIMQITACDRRIDFACKFTSKRRLQWSPMARHGNGWCPMEVFSKACLVDKSLTN